MAEYYTKEFKDAISRLPSLEKDKLILRLLKHDLSLANRLHFELVNTNTVEEQRELVKVKLFKMVEQATKTYYSPGYLKMDIGYMSGEITEYVKLTKDKYGEIYLTLFILNETLERNAHRILDQTKTKARQLTTPVIAKAFKILLLLNKLHEDYKIEFSSEINRLGYILAENPPFMEDAIYNGLDINWLLDTNNIPKNIEAIHKDLRNRGYLK